VRSRARERERAGGRESARALSPVLGGRSVFLLSRCPPLPPSPPPDTFPLFSSSFLSYACRFASCARSRARGVTRGAWKLWRGHFFFTPKPRHKKLKIVLDLVLPLRTVFFSFSHSPLLSIDTLERAFCKLSPPCRLTNKHNKIGGELVGFFFFFFTKSM